MTVSPEIVPTADGSQTMLHPVMRETYHSINGARTESEHVFIRNGFDTVGSDPVRILEAGFGSGLNAWLTLGECEAKGRSAIYTAIEYYPVDIQTLLRLDYAEDPLFMELHRSPWSVFNGITERFTLRKINGDLTAMKFDTVFDLVYFDAFSPDTQPEMWTYEVFKKTYDAMAGEGVLVTYSAKGDVKRALRNAGFEVRRTDGAPGKRHMLRAVKM